MRRLQSLHLDIEHAHGGLDGREYLVDMDASGSQGFGPGVPGDEALRQRTGFAAGGERGRQQRILDGQRRHPGGFQLLNGALR